jgi:phospholipase A-2-activating protein
MYPDEMKLIEQTFTYLSQALAVPPIPPTVDLTIHHTEAVIQILDRWPSFQRFPGTQIPQASPKKLPLYFVCSH